IILPQLPIQHKIANILWTIDDKIELNRRINDNLAS
ncbi:restriction endonuclease subunit S, partial [Alistipes onderdonkii]